METKQTTMTKDQIQIKIDALKPVLQAHNDEYVHCLARGEIVESVEAKKAATKVFNKIGKLVRQKLAAA